MKRLRPLSRSLRMGVTAVGFDCRRTADKTPRHGPSRVTTAEHDARAEPWTVQHLCTPAVTHRHACRMIPKPGVAGSIPAGGTSSCLHRAIPRRRSLPQFVRQRRRRRHMPTCADADSARFSENGDVFGPPQNSSHMSASRRTLLSRGKLISGPRLRARRGTEAVPNVS
jgi:hypothetical protein